MKKFFLLIFLFCAGSVLADISENNYFYEGLIKENGELVKTSVPVSDVKIIGFVCSSSSCSSVSEKLWEGNVLSTEGNYIRLLYPEQMQSAYGYGVYAYKEGYLPLEILSTWSGNGTAVENGSENINRYMYKIENCRPEISSLDTSYKSGELEITATVNSPIENQGSLNYLPSEIADQYTSPVIVNLNISENGKPAYQDSKTISIPFSGTEKFIFSPSLNSGDYDIYVSANSAEGVCLNSIPSFKSTNFKISSSHTSSHSTYKVNSEAGEVFTSSSNQTKNNTVQNNTNNTIQLNPGESQSTLPFFTIFIIVLFLANLVLLIILYFVRYRNS